MFVRIPVIFLSKLPKTQTKKRFLALVKHYTPQFVVPSFPQGPELIVILCILPLFTCRLLGYIHLRLNHEGSPCKPVTNLYPLANIDPCLFDKSIEEKQLDEIIISLAGIPAPILFRFAYLSRSARK